MYFGITLVCAGLAGPPSVAPAAVVVATSRGERAIPVAVDRGHPALPAPALAELLPVSSRHAPDWAVVYFAEQPFRFPIGVPAFVYQNRLTPLAGGAYIHRDTLFVPLQWLAQHIPRIFHEAYRYDPIAARFEEVHMARALADVDRPAEPATRSAPAEPPPAAAAREGLRRRHRVVVDAGHGGRQPGSPGRYLPRGVKEKHVTLAIAKVLRTELERRGIEVVMTRTDDAFVPLLERAPMCHADCDLFVSIHVNSVRNRRDIRGLETYFFEEARTADAARVAAVENEDLRYEAEVRSDDDPLAFIMKDLQRNEYLRESALLADLVHERAARVHPGGSRRVAQANFVVLRAARRPAILVETGYGTNPDDARFLASEQGQRRLARAIAEGIVEYLLRYEGKVVDTSSP